VTGGRLKGISQAHLAAIVESSDDAIFSHALDGTILSWNRAAHRMFGYRLEEAVGASAAMLIPHGSPDALSHILARLRRGHRISQYETVWQRKDGSRFDVSLTISAITDASGEIVAASTIARDITKRKQAEESARRLAAELQHKAYHDALTGLPNRTLFADRLRQALARARRYGNRVAVLLADVNGFKQINDTYGHHAGDAVLIEIARRFQARVRRTDTVARWGGDEFSAVLTDVRAPADAARATEHLIAAFREPMLIAGRELTVTVTIGVSLFPTDAEEPDDLLRRADHAMYRADLQGDRENAFVLFGTLRRRFGTGESFKRDAARDGARRRIGGRAG
jgi:diguanylate cyclase (GGDEF)-like protein/PAS domain S-box-containing protein